MWPNPQFPADLVIFIEEILNGKLHFLCSDLETTSSTFLSKFSAEIFLSQIINYWGSIFTLYLTWGMFSLVCVLSGARTFFLSFLLFSLFLSVFYLADTNDSQDSREGRGNNCFFVYYFHPPTNIHLVHPDFYHFFLIDLSVITRLIAYEACSS